MVTQDLLQDIFEYKDNQLYWKVALSNSIRVGEMAGSLHDGYLRVSINKHRYFVHNLIYIMFLGDIPNGFIVDHIDINRLNNALDNLRIITKQQNTFNRSGVTGTSTRGNKYIARITKDNNTIYLGEFATQKEAEGAYGVAKHIYHTYFNENN